MQNAFPTGENQYSGTPAFSAKHMLGLATAGLGYGGSQEPVTGAGGSNRQFIDSTGDVSTASWRTYNFEVAKHHSYVADNIRVHNTSVEYTLDREGFIQSAKNSAGQPIEIQGKYTPDQLKHYGRVQFDKEGNVTKVVTGTVGQAFGSFVRSFADLVGLDGEFGIRGSFRTTENGHLVDVHPEDEPPHGSQAEGRSFWEKLRDIFSPKTSLQPVDPNSTGLKGDAIYVPPPPPPKSTKELVRGAKGAVQAADAKKNGGGDSNDDNESSRGGIGKALADFARAVVEKVKEIGRSIKEVLGFKPVVIDLDGDGIELAFGSGTTFDVDGDGFQETGAWVSPDDGFLVIDLNADGTRGAGDGVIDQGRELAFAVWGAPGDTDLQGLARAFDLNHDGVLNSQDAVWSELRIWWDFNQNGISEAGELLSLSGLGITEIGLTYNNGASFADTSDDRTVFDNTLHGSASYTRNGTVYAGGVGDVTLSFEAIGQNVTDHGSYVEIHHETGVIRQVAKIQGGAGHDALTGDDQDNWIVGAGGNDTLSGGAGDDDLTAGAGNDQLWGHKGRDVLVGDNGDDYLNGGDHGDALYGGAGNDELWAGAEGGSFASYIWSRGNGGIWDGMNWLSGDFSGDGDSDVAKTWNAGGTTADVHVGHDFGPSLSRWATGQGAFWDDMIWMAGDYNGDGFDDIMKVWSGRGNSWDPVVGKMYAEVYPSNGVVFTGFQRWANAQDPIWSAMNWLSGDFNGDGKDDIMKVWGSGGAMQADVHLSNGSSFTNAAWARNQGAFNDSMTWLAGDFDGDGKDDVMKVWSGAGRSWDPVVGKMYAEVHFSNGNGFFGFQRWADAQSPVWEGMDWMVGDFNGDGKDDIMKAFNDNGKMSADVHLSTGTGFVIERWVTQIGFDSWQMKYLSGDFNGDGRDDFVSVWGDTNGMNADMHISDAETNRLYGGSGNDRLYGQNGNDLLDGGTGSDHLAGGAGADAFYYSLGGGADVVTDFQHNIDRIFLSRFGLSDSAHALRWANQNGSDVIFDFGSGDTLTVKNTSIAKLTGHIEVQGGALRGERIVGTKYVDHLIGTEGIDQLSGHAGHDVLTGGKGDDFLQGGRDIASFGHHFQASQSFGANQTWDHGPYKRTVEDVNGDGLADIVGFAWAGVYTALGQTDGTFGASQLAFSVYGTVDGWGDGAHERIVGDVNGDGRADIVGFGHGGVYVSLGQTDGTFSGIIHAMQAYGIEGGWGDGAHERTVGDVNGDGRADIVGFGRGGVYVSLGQTDGTFSGVIHAMQAYGIEGGWGDGAHERTVGDVNGDGRADIVGFGHGGVYVSLGQTDGTFSGVIHAMQAYGIEGGWGDGAHERTVGDVNGDGRADIVGFGTNGVYVSLGQADGTFAWIQHASDLFGIQDGWAVTTDKRAVGDVDGDGQDDIIAFGSDGVYVSKSYKGNDTLNGGEGNDTLEGGTGEDRFIFRDEAGENRDVIQDFTHGQDKLEFQGGLTFSDLTIAQSNGNTEITFADGDTILLLNISGITASDMIFA